MPLWRRPDGPRQPIRQQATKAECPAFTHLFGMAYGRRRGRQRASLPSSILRFWRAWPIPPCANASSNWAKSLGRPRNRRRKLSLRSKEPRSKNGGLSSRRRESEPSRRNLTRIAVEPSQRLNEILIKKRPPFGGLCLEYPTTGSAAQIVAIPIGAIRNCTRHACNTSRSAL